MLISPAYAQAAGGASQSDTLLTFLPMIAIFVVFYFLLIRPQQKKMKEHREMLAAVRRGDKVVTGGGIIGTVTKVVGDDEVQVEIAEGVRIRVARATLASVQSKSEPVKDDDDKDQEKKPEAANDEGQKKGSTSLIGRLTGKD